MITYKKKSIPVFVALCLAVFACAPKLDASAPATAVIQTDAGEKLCEYVTVQADGTEAQIGVCAENSDKLQRAVALVKVAFPYVKDMVQK